MAATIKKIENGNELDQLLNKTFLSRRDGYVEVGEAKICLPIYYENYEERIRKFEVRDDDVFIIAHPKTGSTWLQELVWLIINDLDYETANTVQLYYRSLQLEFQTLFDCKKLFGIDIDTLSAIDKLKSPRLIKSHLHWSLLPEQIRNGSKKPKFLIVFRSADDVCVSLYHHSKSMDGYKGNFEDFCKLFLGGRVCFGPFWKQVLSCWEQKDNADILFLHYKEMKEDMPSVLKKVAEFFGKTLTQEQIGKLTEHLSFESMKNNPALNDTKTFEKFKDKEGGTEFYRSGKIGDHKSIMSPQLIEEFKKWTEENLKATGLVF